MGLSDVVGSLLSPLRNRDPKASPRLLILLGVFALLLVGAVIYWVVAGGGPERVDVASTNYLYQCTNCGKVVEWTGRQVMEARAKAAQARAAQAPGAAKGGTAAAALHCPHCGGPLAQAERLEDGSIRAHAAPVDAPVFSPEMAAAETDKGKAGKKGRNKGGTKAKSE